MARIRIGGLDVIDSGNIVSPNEQSIQITLEGENPFTVEMQMSFPEDNTETGLEAYNIDAVGIGLRFVNFSNSLGTGNVEPIKLGWFNGRSIFLNYRVFPINNNQGGIFDYTFLLGKKVDADGNEIE
jgi:hypothetical protein|tara:strand:+ start:35 stop:415 length:381 start_codon:yes stop_codon:yes gene_type:complete